MRSVLTLLALTLASSSTWAGPARFKPLDLEQLYAPRLRFNKGVPVVSIGVAEQERALALEVKGGAVELHHHDEGLPKRSFLPPDTALTINLVKAQPGVRSYWVEVGQFPPDQRAQAQALAARYAPRRTLVRSTGALSAVRGKVLDTRELRVWVGGFSRRAVAEDTAADIFRAEGRTTSVRALLTQRPRGTLEVVGPDGLRLRAQDRVYIGTFEGASVRYAGRSYFGHLYAVVSVEGRLALVHSVDAETLLRGLVPAEIFATAPAAALEAQAVVARGAIFALLAHRHFDDPFHLCDEQHCQVYKGSAVTHPATDAAVRATRGQLLVQPRKPGEPMVLVPSVYSASCGGHTADNEVVWDQREDVSLRGRLDGPAGDPLLQSFQKGVTAENLDSWLDGFPPTYCAKSSFTRPHRFRWAKTLEGPGVAAVAEVLGLSEIRELQILGRGGGGRVTGLRVVGPKRKVDVLRELPVRRLFGNLRSGAFTFEATREGERITQLRFRGAGFGHGVGMCQMGAIGRAEAGHDAARILGFYYGGAVLEQLYD